MTFPEDRLPALARIASQLQNTFGNQYLAGLWREYLIRQLGWYHVRYADYLSRNGRKYEGVLNSRQELSLSCTWCTFTEEVRFDDVVLESAEIIECNPVFVNSENR
jgi:hypothetical protein